MSENGEIYTAGNKFYTAAGTDGMDKFHLWYTSYKSGEFFNCSQFDTYMLYIVQCAIYKS